MASAATNLATYRPMLHPDPLHREILGVSGRQGGICRQGSRCDQAIRLGERDASGREALTPGPRLPSLARVQGDDDQSPYQVACVFALAGPKASGQLLDVDSGRAGNVTAVEQFLDSGRGGSVAQVVDQHGGIEEEEQLPNLSGVRSPLAPHPSRGIPLPFVSLGLDGSTGGADEITLFPMVQGHRDRLPNEVGPAAGTGGLVDLIYKTIVYLYV